MALSLVMIGKWNCSGVGMLARHSDMTAYGPKAIVAYWLMPAGMARSFFASIIGELALRFDAPLFEPHVTIYVTERGEDRPAEVLRRALAGCQPFRLSGPQPPIF